MNWHNSLTDDERKRLIEIDKIRADLTTEHRKIYDRCRKRERAKLNSVEMVTPTGHTFIIDDSDHEFISQFPWFAVCHTLKNGKRRTPYIQGNVNGRKVYLHRLLMGEPAGRYIDHIDGDPLNNCKSNLRVVTPKQNANAKNHFTPSLGASNGLSS